jgi:hypothetical protein
MASLALTVVKSRAGSYSARFLSSYHAVAVADVHKAIAILQRGFLSDASLLQCVYMCGRAHKPDTGHASVDIPY